MTQPTRRDVAVAGHTGDAEVARSGLTGDDAAVRATALGALERLGVLSDVELVAALSDSEPRVRRRAAEVAATHPAVDLVPMLSDADPNVVETAAWACGEHESNRPEVVRRLIELSADAAEPLVREAAVAALGAIGDPAAIEPVYQAAGDCGIDAAVVDAALATLTGG